MREFIKAEQEVLDQGPTGSGSELIDRLPPDSSYRLTPGAVPDPTLSRTGHEMHKGTNEHAVVPVQANREQTRSGLGGEETRRPNKVHFHPSGRVLPVRPYKGFATNRAG
ncbi:hypothetical protein ACFVYE_40910 [Streptomyces sp. NPDC058239]|uniref:hypothetical protein n=1 Tax=unclassified Streptomyces TaxID=2593676 RepID=UPI0036665B1A